MTLKEILIAGKLTISEGGGGGGDDIFDKSLPVGEYTTEMTRLENVGNRTGITVLHAPNATYIGSNTFQDWTAVENIYIPNISSFTGTYLFQKCKSLKALACPSMPSSYQVGGHFIEGCTSLKVLDLGNCKGVSAGDAFKNASVLDTVIFRRTDSAATLSNITNFNGTPFASDGSGGTLYVPSALIASYQSASNWSTILGYANNQIKAIEGSYYETHYGDGTPIGA